MRQLATRLAVCCAAAMIAMVGVGAGQAGAAPLPGGGSISGQVVDDGGNPIPGICVGVDSGPSTQTDGAGAYAIGGVMAGTHGVQYSDCNTPQSFIGQWFNGRTDASSSDPVLVTDGQDTALPVVTMTKGATVGGTVTDQAGNPLVGICVDAVVVNGSGWNPIQFANTSADGTYALRQLAAGDVRVHFRDCSPGGPEVDMWNGGAADVNSATPVHLAVGADVSGVDARMSTGIHVEGTVSDSGGNPLRGITVGVNSNGPSAQNGWTQTDTAGHYQTSALPPGDYAVTFTDSNSPATWATQYWNGKASDGSRDTLTLVAGDAPARVGIDATMSAGASVSGTVTDLGGAPLGGICVRIGTATDPSFERIADVTTGNDGTYSFEGLPAIGVQVDFGGCRGPGPYLEQWWNGVGLRADAETITLVAGERRSAIDAHLGPSGSIRGTVTDSTGAPLSDICVQASTTSFVGSSTRTSSNGGYTLYLSRSGDYRVQFVDCADTHRYAGQWADGRATLASARSIGVQPGQSVTGVDAVLATGAVGSISGRVVNQHGVPIRQGCVVAFLPYDLVILAAVGTDGTYEVTGIPSGTYALAFLSCREGTDPSSVVADPENSAIHYAGRWSSGTPLVIPDDHDGSPDPIAQGETLVSVAPGEHLTGYDQCFGCVSFPAPTITAGTGSLTVAFVVTAPILALSAGNAVSGAGVSALSYTATCVSTTGGTAGTATGAGSPITVGGLTPGASYTCVVVASDRISPVGTSPRSAPAVVAADVVSRAPVAPGWAASPVTTHAATPLRSATMGLAVTGAGLTGPLADCGIGLVAVGLGFLVLARRKRPTARP